MNDTKHVTLAEIGAQFHESRVHRGVLIEDVAKSLKISSKILRAIEDGNREALPQLVFLRGFIKSYGQFLGFPDADLQNALAHLENNEPKPDLAPRAPEKSTYMSDTPYVSKKVLRKRAFMMFIIALIVLASAYFLYTFLFTPYLKEAKQAEPVNTVLETVEDEQALALTNAILSSASQVGAEIQIDTALEMKEARQEQDLNALTAEVATQIAMDAINEGQTRQAENPFAAQAPSPITAIPPIDEVPAFIDDDELARLEQEAAPPEFERVSTFGSGRRTLLITASADCWISFELDYREAREVFLAPGQEVFVRFETEAKLRVGNAGGINITYNGQDLGAPGNLGQVRRLTYP